MSKIRLSFKTPDASDQLDEDVSDADRDVIKKFVEYGEYIQLEIDTDAKTCVVIPV